MHGTSGRDVQRLASAFATAASTGGTSVGQTPDLCPTCWRRQTGRGFPSLPAVHRRAGKCVERRRPNGRFQPSGRGDPERRARSALDPDSYAAPTCAWPPSITRPPRRAPLTSRRRSAPHPPRRPRKLVGRIGPWQLVRLISESELARVYVARPAEAPPKSPAAYVVKVLRKEWWRDPHAIEMQRRAAWVGRKVSHPNLLPVLSAGVEQPPFYIVSPKLEAVRWPRFSSSSDGCRWPSRCGSSARWPRRSTRCTRPTRMIHADVKPANIIVAPDGHATLVDLGFVHTPAESRHWSTRPVYGTLNYMAPEALTSSLATSPQSDVYSLGVTLYEMLAGGLPFVGRDAEHLIRQHREAKPECLRVRRPETPKPVASLVHRMLAKDPLRRPESAAAVADGTGAAGNRVLRRAVSSQLATFSPRSVTGG